MVYESLTAQVLLGHSGLKRMLSSCGRPGLGTFMVKHPPQIIFRWRVVREGSTSFLYFRTTGTFYVLEEPYEQDCDAGEKKEGCFRDEFYRSIMILGVIPGLAGCEILNEYSTICPPVVI